MLLSASPRACYLRTPLINVPLNTAPGKVPLSSLIPKFSSNEKRTSQRASLHPGNSEVHSTEMRHAQTVQSSACGPVPWPIVGDLVVMATGTLTAQPRKGMAQNLYGHGVRMGNWNEDVYLEEELMKDFLEKRDKGQLLIQRSIRLKESLLRPVQLSISKDGHIHHGDSVMLVNPDYPETEADLSLRGDLSLCLAPDEIRAYLSDTPEVPCGLTVAPTNIPVGRNTFIILSAEPAATGDVLRFGQNFRLGIVRGFDDTMLYLSSDHRTLLKSSKRSWLQEVYLTDEVSYLNCWQAAFPDPQLRLEHEGFPIPANSKILINHCHTNRGLAAHRHLFLRTYFGKEAEVAAHTHLDSHRAEKPRNHWMLVTGSPRKDSGTVLDEGTPPAQNTCALEQAAGPGAQ